MALGPKFTRATKALYVDKDGRTRFVGDDMADAKVALTREQVEEWRYELLRDYMADDGICDPVNRLEINTLCDLALRSLDAPQEAPSGYTNAQWLELMKAAPESYQETMICSVAHGGRVIPLYAHPPVEQATRAEAEKGGELADALLKIKRLVCGEAAPNWTGDLSTYKTRGLIADIVDEALRGTKERV